MKELNFTKKHTQIAKEVAILLMLAHHLFAFPARIYVEQGYISMLSIRGYNIEYIIGRFGSLCVAIYLFLSGYGIYMIIQKKGIFTLKDAFKRVKNMYINYWIVFIIFIPLGFIFFNKNFNIREFLLNLVGLSSSYNGEWWFFRLYIELILVVPLLKIVVSDNVFKSLINITGLVILSKVLIIIPSIKYITSSIIYEDITDLLYFQGSFCMGYICAKFDIYSEVIKQFIKYKIDNKFIYILLSISVVVIRCIIGNRAIIDFILAPIFIFAMVNMLYNSVVHKLFITLGKHSTNMWLTHSFFCYTYLQWLVFKPRISILILIFLVILSICSSILVNYIIKSYNIIVLKLKNRTGNNIQFKESHL